MSGLFLIPSLFLDGFRGFVGQECNEVLISIGVGNLGVSSALELSFLLCSTFSICLCVPRVPPSVL